MRNTNATTRRRRRPAPMRFTVSDVARGQRLRATDVTTRLTFEIAYALLATRLRAHGGRP